MLFSLKTRLFVIAAMLILGGCATTYGNTPAERRQVVQNMKAEVLAELYKAHPSAKAEIAAATGYAAFSNANVNVIFASFSGGYGVVTDNKYSLDRFVNSGWAFGGHADAAAKAGDKGAAVGGEALIDGITIYQFTQSGLALQVTVKGTKYWKDDELN